MKRVYLVIDGHGKVMRKIRCRQPKNAPTSTHWAWWNSRVYENFEYVPGCEGEVLPCDQTLSFPVRRLQ